MEKEIKEIEIDDKLMDKARLDVLRDDIEKEKYKIAYAKAKLEYENIKKEREELEKQAQSLSNVSKTVDNVETKIEKKMFDFKNYGKK